MVHLPLASTVCTSIFQLLIPVLNQDVRTAIQLTKLSGFSPIITTSSLRHEEYLKSLGATHVLDRTLPSAAIESEVSKLVGGKPIELVYDAISHADTQPLAYDILAPGGHLILVLPDLVLAEKKKEGDNKTIVSVAGSVQMPENRALGVALYSRLTEWLETGKLVVRLIVGILLQ